MMKMAQIAFRDLPQVHRERYTFDAFVQSINDLGLHHQLQAKGVTTVKGALTVGEAYFLVKPHAPEPRGFPPSRCGALRCPFRTQYGEPSSGSCDTDDASVEDRSCNRHASPTGRCLNSPKPSRQHS